MIEDEDKVVRRDMGIHRRGRHGGEAASGRGRDASRSQVPNLQERVSKGEKKQEMLAWRLEADGVDQTSGIFVCVCLWKGGVCASADGS